jgi:hypothetical protein
MDVASFAPNAWGLCDMHGNVAEWCLDHFSYAENFYESPEATGRNPVNEEATAGDRTVRGGSWVDVDEYSHGELCRSSARIGMSPDERAEDLGFRVAWFDAAPDEIRGAAMMADAIARAALPPPDAAAQACQENLARLDGAVAQWALDNGAAVSDTVTLDQIVQMGYLRAAPVCPAGGTYGSPGGSPNSFTAGGEVTCSLGGTHTLPH